MFTLSLKALLYANHVIRVIPSWDKVAAVSKYLGMGLCTGWIGLLLESTGFGDGVIFRPVPKYIDTAARCLRSSDCSLIAEKSKHILPVFFLGHCPHNPWNF